jgi:hypothetical protein
VGSLTVVLVVTSVAVATMQLFEITPVGTDTIVRSLAVRGTLWSHAIEVGVANLPMKVGVDQFTAASGGIPELVVERHKVAHSTALTWIAEFELLGLVFAI